MGNKKTEYITAKEAAELAGVNSSTIYRWMEQGDIASITVAGTMKHIDKQSLLDHLGPGFKKVHGSA